MTTSRPRGRTGVVAARVHIASLSRRAGTLLVVVTGLCNVGLGVLPVAFIVCTSIMLGRVPAAVAGGVNSAAWDSLVAVFVIAAAAFVGQQILGPVQTSLGELVARRVDGYVFGRLMAASLRSPGIAALEDQRVLDQLSEASRELEHPVQSPGKACAGLLALIARYVQLVLCVAVVGVTFSWPAALAVFAATMVFRYGQRGGLRKFSYVYGRVAGTIRESLYLRQLATRPGAAKDIRVFGLVDWLQARFRAAYLSWLKPVWAERRRIHLKPYLWYTAAGLIVATVALGTLGTAAAGRSLDLTSLAMAMQATLAALRLGDFYPEADTQTQLGMNAYDAVRGFEQAVEQYAIAANPNAPTVPVPRGAIHFRGVRFRYPGEERDVLDGLDLTIPVGRSTAIVGVNGAGKTTLVKLLTRLYEPTAGAVCVDGVDLRGVPVRAWREQIAVVFQDFLRYEVSAAANIGFGAVGQLADRSGIRWAARTAGIEAALDRLPEGLDTPLAAHLTGGAELSGGQWQRVALARALFSVRHGASVLVLDEPTASLDVRAEARFFSEFVELTRGITTVLISHRFSTVRHADTIVVVDGGRVLEQGSHDELLRYGGRYSELFALQAARFVDDDAPADAQGAPR